MTDSFDTNRLKKEAFAVSDTRGTGKIEPRLLGFALRASGKRITDQHIEELMSKASEYGPDIEYSTFCEMYDLATTMEITEQDVKTAFDTLSSFGGKESKNGCISISDLKTNLSELGDMMTEAEMDFFLNQKKLNKTNLTYEEFVAATAPCI